jgi:hypothetical protein
MPTWTNNSHICHILNIMNDVASQRKLQTLLYGCWLRQQKKAYFVGSNNFMTSWLCHNLLHPWLMLNGIHKTYPLKKNQKGWTKLIFGFNFH